MTEEHKHEESIMEKIAEKIHGHDDSSSSDSDDEKKESSIKTKIYRLFGREKPVHKVFGGGKRTDLFYCFLNLLFFFLLFGFCFRFGLNF